MSDRLTPNPDIYGRYARASALADYLELLALSGHSPTLAELTDCIRDNNWNLAELVELPAAQEEAEEVTQDDAADAATRVFDAIAERSHILNERYPFDMESGRLLVRKGLEQTKSSYLAVLAIAVAHAYRLETKESPKYVFEETVCAAVRRQTVMTANLGGIARRSACFEDAVEEAGGLIALCPTPRAAARMRRAQDENVDILCHLPWGDTRPGLWTMIGQVTCAKSEAWETKICEASPPAWVRFLNVQLRPLVFLAVPHHVEPSHLYKLVQDSENMVLDRLRLVRFKDSVLEPERQIIDRVLSCRVENIQ